MAHQCLCIHLKPYPRPIFLISTRAFRARWRLLMKLFGNGQVSLLQASPSFPTRNWKSARGQYQGHMLAATTRNLATRSFEGGEWLERPLTHDNGLEDRLWHDCDVSVDGRDVGGDRKWKKNIVGERKYVTSWSRACRLIALPSGKERQPRDMRQEQGCHVPRTT